MSPVLFLDFDGVLHPTTVDDDGLFMHAQALVETLEPFACEVVISSNWRHSWPLDVLLAKLPLALAQRVCGTTGDAHIGALARYVEIQNYLMLNGNPSWRALDDVAFEFPPNTPELILCDPSFGLTKPELQAVRSWLIGNLTTPSG